MLRELPKVKLRCYPIPLPHFIFRFAELVALQAVRSINRSIRPVCRGSQATAGPLQAVKPFPSRATIISRDLTHLADQFCGQCGHSRRIQDDVTLLVLLRRHRSHRPLPQLKFTGNIVPPHIPSSIVPSCCNDAIPASTNVAESPRLENLLNTVGSLVYPTTDA
jgi:hypothetical protein